MRDIKLPRCIKLLVQATLKVTWKWKLSSANKHISFRLPVIANSTVKINEWTNQQSLTTSLNTTCKVISKLSLAYPLNSISRKMKDPEFTVFIWLNLNQSGRKNLEVRNITGTNKGLKSQGYTSFMPFMASSILAREDHSVLKICSNHANQYHRNSCLSLCKMILI